MLKKVLDHIFNLNRLTKLSIQVITDIILIIISLTLALSLSLNNFLFLSELIFWQILFILSPITIFIFAKLGLYRAIIRFISQKAMLTIILGVGFSTILLITLNKILDFGIPRVIPIMYFVTLFLTVSGIRFILRELRKTSEKDNRTKVAIYGAGEAGRQILRTLNSSSEYKPIIFIDDDVKLQNYEIDGLLVHALESGLRVLSQHTIKAILISIPSASKSTTKAIIRKLEKSAIEVKILPGITDLIEGRTQVNDLRSVSVEELLGRDVIPPISILMTKNITNKVILVTGAGGSIGSELCRQILNQFPKKLILLDISEYALYNIYQELTATVETSKRSIELCPFICSVQNADSISKILKLFQVETIYHTAAYKHVPLVEANVAEGIHNNVFGTLNLVKSAIESKVENFILISTDKAVRPTNFMGASKRLAELICQAYSKTQSKTQISMVRFGNVLGSSGSVIPQFEAQIKRGGPVTLTHKDINRYFMSIPEAAELVIQAGSMAVGGDVFVLDMGPPIKIIELAKKMIRLQGLIPYLEGENNLSAGDIEIKIVGLRAGEKLFEELLIGKDPTRTQHPRIVTAQEPHLGLEELTLILDDIKAAIAENNLILLAETIARTPTDFSPQKNSIDIILNNSNL